MRLGLESSPVLESWSGPFTDHTQVRWPSVCSSGTATGKGQGIHQCERKPGTTPSWKGRAQISTLLWRTCPVEHRGLCLQTVAGFHVSRGQSWAPFVRPCWKHRKRKLSSQTSVLMPGYSPGLSRFTVWQDHSLVALCPPLAVQFFTGDTGPICPWATSKGL